jgi:hypothetical protein
VSNAPPTQPHCDPRRPSCVATSGCCCRFVAQRRRRKAGSRKMAGSKTIIRSRRRPPIENESERCATKRAKPSIDRSTGTGYCTITLLKCLSYSPTTTTTTTTTQRSSDERLNYTISMPYCPKKTCVNIVMRAARGLGAPVPTTQISKQPATVPASVRRHAVLPRPERRAFCIARFSLSFTRA